MQNDSRIWVAGFNGLVGSAICRRLEKEYTNILTDWFELTDATLTEKFFEEKKPEYVFLAAAKVGGIAANDAYPADFIRINLQIQTNVIDCCYRHKVKKLLFLGSSCIYPKLCPQPMKEEYFLSGKLEPTNDAYAIAKIAGLIMCKSYNRQHGTNFIAAMPTNLYGPGDNFHLQSSHVLPALIRKFHEGKQANAPTVEVWGTGMVRREFLFVDDLADCLVYLMNTFNAPNDRDETKMFFNIGTGVDITIKDLANLVKDTIGYKGEIVWNTSMPDGTPQKLLDVSNLTSQGWKAKIKLEDGVRLAYQWFLEHEKDYRTEA